MKKFFVLAVVCFVYHTSPAQKGARFLAQDDPLVGNWQFNADSSQHTNLAPIVKGERIIELLPGIEVGMMAQSRNGNTYQKASYFVAKKDANKIYCSISESDYTYMAGKDISFNYEYNPASDMLIVVIGDKKYYYTRIK
ncbi:MAG TPA: hypothetical protein VD905_16440 [Flavobacteriales bacterium]|nr:hypothetical protein [Flavobacteriales bacterium]